MELECGYSPPRQNNRNLIFLAPSHSGLAKVAAGKITPGKGTAVRRSCFLPHSTDIDYKLLHTHMHSLPPPRSLASVALKPPAWQAGLCQRRNSGCGTRWLLAGAGFPPLWQSRVSMVYVLLCWGVFPVPTLYSPRSIVWGLFFFSSLSSCYAVFFLPLSTYLHFTTHCTLYDCVCDQ